MTLATLKAHGEFTMVKTDRGTDVIWQGNEGGPVGGFCTVFSSPELYVDSDTDYECRRWALHHGIELRSDFRKPSESARLAAMKRNGTFRYMTNWATGMTEVIWTAREDATEVHGIASVYQASTVMACVDWVRVNGLTTVSQ